MLPQREVRKLWVSSVAGSRVYYKGSFEGSLLGGSGVVISGVISPLIWVITIVTLLRTPLISTPEPPSKGLTNCIYTLGCVAVRGWLCNYGLQVVYIYIHVYIYICMYPRSLHVAIK